MKNIKLGAFVVAGLCFLILLLYMIGKNQNLFGAHFELKTRFENVQGLTTGNNIRFAGIQAGSVKDISVINDTTIEVTMFIKSTFRKYIRKNAVTSLGTDGLVGNRIINISPGKEASPTVSDGDVLLSRETFDTDDLLQTLAKTTGDISHIADGLRLTVARINNSQAIWTLLNDESIPVHLRASLANTHRATTEAANMATTLNQLAGDIKEGKGAIGALLTDSLLTTNIHDAVNNIRVLGSQAILLAHRIDSLTQNLSHEITEGKGALPALLKDSTWSRNLEQSLHSIREGTDRFNSIMEAAKNSILFRGYFRKQERRKEKQKK